MSTRVVVEWTRTTLRVAVAEWHGSRGQLRALHVQPLEGGASPADTLRALRKTAFGAASEIIVVVSREQVISRVVKFPATDPLELTRMVDLYAKAQLPYPKEQSITDFHVVRQQEGFSTVAIVVCQREIIDQHLHVLREAKLSPTLLTVSSWGVLGWYQGLRSAEAGRTPESSAPEPTLVVNVDADRTDLVLVKGERLLSSRSLGQGAAEWGALSDATELLALEVERTRSAIRKELPEQEVRSLILTGRGPLEEWGERLQARVRLLVTVLEARRPFSGCPAGPTSVSPVVVGGLACSPLQGLLNLNPVEIQTQVRHRRQLRELLTVSAMLAAVLVLGSGVLAVQVARQQARANQLDKVLSQLGPTAKQLQKKSSSAQTVKSVLEDRRRLAVTLSGVFRATPSAVALEGLMFERGRRELTLRGSATSTQAVLDYVKQLGTLDGVSEAQLKYSTRRATPAGERTDFEISVQQGSSPVKGGG